jgi:hypothetical protein
MEKINMFINGKVISGGAIPGMRGWGSRMENGGGGEFKYAICDIL